MAEIMRRVGVKAPAKKVYEALTRKAALAGGWTRTTKTKPNLGAVLQFPFANGGPDMEVRELKLTKPVQWKFLAGPHEWIGTERNFDLKTQADEPSSFSAIPDGRNLCEFVMHCSSKRACFPLGLKSLVKDGHDTPYPGERAISNWG